MSIALATPLDAIALDNRDALVDETGEHGFPRTLWDRLVTRIKGDLEFKQAFGSETDEVQTLWASVLLDQALGFMRVCGHYPGSGPYAPSRLVDIAWHAFILYTMDYANFCQVNFGRFLHHIPDDEPGAVLKAADEVNYLARTVDAMTTNGITVIEAAWPGRADCHIRCHEVNCVNATLTSRATCSHTQCTGGDTVIIACEGAMATTGADSG